MVRLWSVCARCIGHFPNFTPRYPPPPLKETKRTSPQKTELQPNNEITKIARLLDPPKPPEHPCRSFVTPKQLDRCIGDNAFLIGC